MKKARVTTKRLQSIERCKPLMAGLEAETLIACAQVVGGAHVIRRVYAERERNVAELRQLARLVVARPGLVALLGIAGEKAQWVFARSAESSYDMTVFIRAAAQMLNAQGGGQPALARRLGQPGCNDDT